jgi:hypothetical protein
MSGESTSGVEGTLLEWGSGREKKCFRMEPGVPRWLISETWVSLDTVTAFPRDLTEAAIANGQVCIYAIMIHSKCNRMKNAHWTVPGSAAQNFMDPS